MGSTESQILSSLGITDPTLQSSIISGATRLLILDASAHMDWDWLLPFPVLVNGGPAGTYGTRAAWYFQPYNQQNPTGPVRRILGDAGGLLADPSYRYSVCETGFLRGYAQADPAGFQTLLRNGAANGSLRFTGGGITSPDNAVSHGEAFVRAYLLGHLWLAANCPGLPAPVTAWIPDDFGHDPELPVVLQAMGMVAAGFERIPGYTGNGQWRSTVLDGSPTTAAAVAAGTIDFTWSAADGSSVAAHWLIGGYGQGNTVQDNADIEGYLALNLPRSPTPYVYVPVLSDFSIPNANLSQVIGGWNGTGMQGRSYDGVTVVAAAGSFEEYGQLLGFHAASLQASYGAEFAANPYWTGYYVTRPALKQRHQAATRALLAAETFAVIAGWAQPDGGSLAFGSGSTEGDALRQAWELLAPSTHHDYVTGTAIPDVYRTEQLRLLDQAVAAAGGLLRDAMDTIAGSILPSSTQSGTPVAVFNALGWERAGVVALGASAAAEANLSASGTGFQAAADGGLLFLGGAPSLGYRTAYLPDSAAPATPASCSAPIGPVTGASVSFSNGLVSATLAPAANGVWGLTSVLDLENGAAELVAAGKVANDLHFYADGGDEYQLGMEASTWTLTDVSDRLSAPAAEVLEAGPLRVTVRTTVRYDDGSAVIDFVRDYTLCADEPILRMRSSGAAPMLSAGGNRGCTVVVAFPFEQPIASVVHGTPYHWTAVQPAVYWNDQTFVPTHDWVIPRDSLARPMAAVYHAGIHAWGLSNQWNGSSFAPNDGVLYGCLWRNGDGHYYDWTQPSPGTWALGTDPEAHVLEYALRVPYGLGAPETGAPLREARAFSTPLLARPVAPWTGSLADTGSLASASPETAIVTVAKPGSVAPGDVVFRVYQPTNAPLSVSLAVDPRVAGASAAARGQTALEQDLDAAAAGAMDVQLQGGTVTFTAPTALSTIAVSPAPVARPRPEAGTPGAGGEPPGCLGGVFRALFG